MKIKDMVLVSLFAVVCSCKSSKSTVAKNAVVEKPKTRLGNYDQKNRKVLEESVRRDAESTLWEMKESAPKFRLHEYFEAIAGADNSVMASRNIKDALAMFASTETPVLIVLSEVEGRKDYAKATTIMAYLNYLRDGKKDDNDIGALQVNAEGKITRLELKKID